MALTKGYGYGTGLFVRKVKPKPSLETKFSSQFSLNIAKLTAQKNSGKSTLSMFQHANSANPYSSSILMSNKCIILLSRS